MSKLNVILIDDSLADRRAIKSLLRQVAADISVTEVETVAAAYLNEGRSFDAVYLDNWVSPLTKQSVVQVELLELPAAQHQSVESQRMTM